MRILGLNLRAWRDLSRRVAGRPAKSIEEATRISDQRSLAARRLASQAEVPEERSLAALRLAAQVEAAARTDLAVLLEGETGTGKEGIARRLHDLGANGAEPFLVLHCASLSGAQLEGELFGRGAGGPEPERAGMLEAAGHGTVFLDEVGDLPAGVQSRLAGVLERAEVVRVGEIVPRRVLARVVASTHRDLRAEIRAGRFRQDFYFRIAAFPIRVPPLRDRLEDLPAIVERLAADAQRRIGREATGIDDEAVALLATGRWPGNLRQLENALVRATALAPEGSPIRFEHLDPELFAPEPEVAESTADGPTGGRAGGATDRKPLRSARAEFEASYIAESLAEQRGNVSRTARLLGVSRVALHKKIVAYGLR